MRKQWAAACPTQVVACKAPSEDLKADVAAALAKGNGAKKHVVIVCSNVDAALEGTNAGLAAEVEQLQQVQAAVDAAEIDSVVVYASQPVPRAADLAAQAGKRRSLLATYTGFGPYTSCGTLCQVRALGLAARPTARSSEVATARFRTSPCIAHEQAFRYIARTTGYSRLGNGCPP